MQPRDFQIGQWVVEPSLNTLRRGDESRRLGHKVMATLLCLAEAPGRVFSKDELSDRVWEQRFTSDEVLTTVVYELRKALDDEARNPRYVETIRKRGYRLVAPVTELSVMPETSTNSGALRGPASPGGRASDSLALRAAALVAVLLAGLVFASHRMNPTPRPASDQVASRTVGAVATPTPPAGEAIPGIDPEVDEALKLGSHFLRQGTARGNNRAQSYFSRAVALSPALAPAHAGLADAYLAEAGGVPGAIQSVTYQQAKAAAQTALEIDSTSPQAHLTLASVYFQHEWDWLEADKHFRLGYAANLCPVEGSRQVSAYLSAMGRHEEAIGALRSSLRRDPASKTGRWSLAWSYYLARRYDEALRELGRVRELDPSYMPIFQLESEVFLTSSADEQAFFAYQRLFELSGDGPEEVAAMSAVYARSGIEGVLRRLIERELERSTEFPVDSIRLASLEARLGSTESALDWLHRAYSERDGGLVWLQVEPAFDSLRTSERFRRLLADVGLYPPS